MKRLLILAMASLLLTACGDTKENNEVEVKPTEEKPVEQKVTLSESKVSFTNVTIEIKKHM